MPKRQTPEGVTIGFFGTGSMDVDLGMNLMEEYIDGNVKPEESVRWVFMLTSEEFSDTLGEYVAMAKESDIAYEVITKSGDKARRSFAEISNDAAHVYNVEDPLLQLETVLTESTRSALFVLWDKDRTTEIEEVLNGFIDAGIKCFDLTEGLVPLGPDDTDTDTEEPAAVAAVAEPEPEDVDEEGEEIFSRTELEKMSREELKEVATQLNIPPRRSSEAMIKDILAAQEEEPSEAEEAVEVLEAVEEVAIETLETVEGVLVEAATVTVDVMGELTSLLERLNDLPERFAAVLDEFATKLTTRLEQAVPAAPPAPEPAEEPVPRRRIVRRG